MCNRQVEKFNGTLKSMVKKMTIEEPRDWNHYFPAVLFAYRGVPRESLGFSPFELLYGRTFCGTMSILREIWASEEELQEDKTAYQYVMELWRDSRRHVSYTSGAAQSKRKTGSNGMTRTQERRDCRWMTKSFYSYLLKQLNAQCIGRGPIKSSSWSE